MSAQGTGRPSVPSWGSRDRSPCGRSPRSTRGATAPGSPAPGHRSTCCPNLPGTMGCTCSSPGARSLSTPPMWPATSGVTAGHRSPGGSTPDSDLHDADRQGFPFDVRHLGIGLVPRLGEALSRKDLAEDPGLVGGDGTRQPPAGLEGEPDAVGDVQASLLAGVLHRPDHLTGQTLGSQVRCDLDVQGDAVRPLVLDL